MIFANVVLSDTAIDIVRSAQEITAECGYKEVDYPHLFLPLIEDEDYFSYEIIENIGIDIDDLRRILLSSCFWGYALRKSTDIPLLSRDVRGLINVARMEACRRDSEKVHSHHLLLAFLGGHNPIHSFLDDVYGIGYYDVTCAIEYIEKNVSI